MWRRKKIKICIILKSIIIFLIIKLIECDKNINNFPRRSYSHFLTADALKSYLTQLISQNTSTWKCPAPIFPLHEKGCHVQTCDEKRPCLVNDEACCFNGCVFTCLKQLMPPPVIDWELKPFNIKKQGGNDVRPCSTSPRPAPSEPVGCPKGFKCQLANNSTSSRGTCVPVEATVIHDVDEASHLQENIAHETVYLPGGCILSKTQYSHMQEFLKKSFVIDCFCREGSVLCQLNPFRENVQLSDNPPLNEKTKNL